MISLLFLLISVKTEIINAHGYECGLMICVHITSMNTIVYTCLLRVSINTVAYPCVINAPITNVVYTCLAASAGSIYTPNHDKIHPYFEYSRCCMTEPILSAISIAYVHSE